MLKISTKVKHGGIWNGTRVVKEMETDDAVLAEYYKSQGFIVEETEIALDKMTVAQLKKYAKKNGIELNGETDKDAIVAIIEGVEKDA